MKVVHKFVDLLEDHQLQKLSVLVDLVRQFFSHLRRMNAYTSRGQLAVRLVAHPVVLRDHSQQKVV
jgi:hypothetical protein